MVGSYNHFNNIARGETQEELEKEDLRSRRMFGHTFTTATDIRKDQDDRSANRSPWSFAGFDTGKIEGAPFLKEEEIPFLKKKDSLPQYKHQLFKYKIKYLLISHPELQIFYDSHNFELITYAEIYDILKSKLI